MATRATVASTSCPSPPPPPVIPVSGGTCANGGAGASGSTLLCPQTTVRDYNKFLVQTLEAGDTERQALLGQLQALGEALAPLGDVRADLHARTRELHDAQRIATEQALALQEERERGARLMAENHTLMAEQDDQRAKIAALLNMRMTEADTYPGSAACPVMVQLPTKKGAGGNSTVSTDASATTQPARCGLGVHVTEPQVPTLSLRSVVEANARGAVPPAPMESASRQHTSDATTAAAATTGISMMTGHSRKGASGAKATEETTTTTAVDGPPPGSALVASLSAEVRTLQQLLDEQRAAYERDRAKQIADTRRMEQDLHRELKKHSSTIDELHRRLHQAVSELCVYRHDAQITERRLRGEVEILTARAAEAERLLSVERSRRSADVQSALESQHARTGHVVDHVRNRLADTEEKARKDVAKREKAIASLEDALRRAQDEAARERRIRVRCEQRLRAEQEGRLSDVGLLRQQLRALEKRVFFNTIHGEDAVAAGAVQELDHVKPHAAVVDYGCYGLQQQEVEDDASSEYTATTADGASGEAGSSGSDDAGAPRRRSAHRQSDGAVGTGAAASFPKYDPSRVAAITEAIARVDNHACVIHGSRSRAAPAGTVDKKTTMQPPAARMNATTAGRKSRADDDERGRHADDEARAKRRAAQILADLMGTRAFAKKTPS